MSQGGPLSEPLSGLAVCMYTWGSPWHHAGRAYHHAVPRVGRRARVGKAALRRRGKFPSLFSTTSLGEAGTKFGSARAGNFGHRSSVGKRSVASGGGVVGGFRPDLAKPVFGAYFWGQVKLFDF